MGWDAGQCDTRFVLSRAHACGYPPPASLPPGPRPAASAPLPPHRRVRRAVPVRRHRPARHRAHRRLGPCWRARRLLEGGVPSGWGYFNVPPFFFKKKGPCQTDLFKQILNLHLKHFWHFRCQRGITTCSLVIFLLCVVFLKDSNALFFLQMCLPLVEIMIQPIDKV